MGFLETVEQARAFLERNGRASLRGLSQRLGRLPRSLDRTIWVHGDDPRLFRLVEPLLERSAVDYPRNVPRFTSSLPGTRHWLRKRHSPEAAPALPFPGGGCPARFIRNLKPHLLVVLEPCEGPGSAVTRRFERLGRSVLRLGEAELREPQRLYDRLAAEIEFRRPKGRALSRRRALEARFLATGLGRATRRIRTRPFDLEGLDARLGRPDTILCLGNGPSCEDPRLEHLSFDALFRVNYRWLERGAFAHPNMVFLGESKTLRHVRGCVFGFRTVAEEKRILDRYVLRWRPRIEHFCLERVSHLLDEGRWAARPTNGMSMLATAVLLRPRRLIVAGIDLFEHAEGSYPGAPDVPNGYAAVHRREVEVAIVRQLLARHEGQVEIVGKPLRRALGMTDASTRADAAGVGFPKIIHQTWKTRDLSSIEEFRLCAESWKRHHPGYEYRLWDDRDNDAFVAERFGWYLDTWRSFDKNIKRLDSIRYMWMYEYGGIYADLDMECLQSLEGLASSHEEHEVILFCDLDSSRMCISANPALIISRPGSGFWLKILEYARENKDRYVTHCTGPYALGLVANAHRERFRIKFLDQNELFIRKSKKDLYRKISGNELDYSIYKDVYCATPKPAKYFEDKKKKYVADWHGTPRQYHWHREYESKPERWFRRLLPRDRARAR